MPKRQRKRSHGPRLGPLWISLAILATALLVTTALVLSKSGDSPADGAAATDKKAPPYENKLKGTMTVIAHRGQLAGYPENSVAGIRAALQGPDVDGVEMDVRISPAGELVLAHDAPAPDEAPLLGEALALLSEEGVSPRKFFVLDIKGDGLFASIVHDSVPPPLRNRTIFMVATLPEAFVFRGLAPDARLYVNLRHAEQGELVPSELGAEAVVLNAGKSTVADIRGHQQNGTPVVVHAINSMRRSHELNLVGIIVGVGAEGKVGEVLGPTK